MDEMAKVFGGECSRALKRYFFDQDNALHWYLVDADRRAEWTAWRDLPDDDPDGWELPDASLAMRLDGGPSHWSFADPNPPKEATDGE